MDIRAITIGINNNDKENLALLKELINNILKFSFARNKKITTIRLLAEPFTIHRDNCIEDSSILFERFEKWRNILAATWFCIPFRFKRRVDVKEITKFLRLIMIKYDASFINFLIDTDGYNNLHIMDNAGKIIKEISSFEKNGFANFKFGYSFNIKPHTPYFPFSYHEGNTGFSIAYELTKPILSIIEKNKSLDIIQLEHKIIKEIYELCNEEVNFFEQLKIESGFEFYGIDFSLAPMANINSSVLYLLNILNKYFFKSRRNMFLTYYLTNILNTIAHQFGDPVGFNGIMYSILEDKELGDLHVKQNVNIDSLLAYSTMCGCGLDMIPVSGNISEKKLVALLFEVYSISKKFEKPLGYRILPIPQKKNSEMTEFDHPFLANTKVLKI